jgi:hypothetical protein
MIDIDYDIRAPDYSYLLIAEMKETSITKSLIYSERAKVKPSSCFNYCSNVYKTSNTELPEFQT